VARTQAPARLRRLSDLYVIRRAVARSQPTATANIGLTNVATACQMRDVRGPAARDDLLTIVCEWDLASDQLDGQSDECVAAIARVLRA
jgi:hypothetical protein